MTVTKHGRSARTDWQVEKSLRRFALLRCFPRTGRTHQIRVHLKSIGLPLAVDPLYNSQAPRSPVGIYLSRYKRDYRPTFGEEERPLIARLTLHAEKITFTRIDGISVTIECPAPKDFRAAVNQLSKL
jgi:23S rRNA pseudouridine955/2504/2580 synthase/23S rRNA pseudouridine1911/1915/1917 synthase